jgi:plasmid maintenance system killer protein
MKTGYSERAGKTLESLTPQIRKALFKQMKLLEQNLRHPSLRAKKYDERQNLWQARVNKDWRFYFLIQNDVYYIVDIIPHPK